MRVIPLTHTVLNAPGHPPDAPFVYADVIRTILMTPGRGGGISTAEGLTATDIGAKVKSGSGGETLLLEEAEWQFLCNKLRDFQWAVWEDVVAEFVRAIQGAKVYDPPAPALGVAA